MVMLSTQSLQDKRTASYGRLSQPSLAFVINDVNVSSRYVRHKRLMNKRVAVWQNCWKPFKGNGSGLDPNLARLASSSLAFIIVIVIVVVIVINIVFVIVIVIVVVIVVVIVILLSLQLVRGKNAEKTSRIPKSLLSGFWKGVPSWLKQIERLTGRQIRVNWMSNILISQD